MSYVTVEDVYRISGLPTDGTVISENDVNMHIDAAEAYVERMLGTCFQPGGKSVTETYDGDGSDTLFLDHYPIKSITSLTIDSTSVTVASYLWYWAQTGKIKLKSSAEATKFTSTYPQLVSITYVYGEEPDERIRHYTGVIAATMALVAQIGGTFDDITSFQVPEISGSLGEPWTNIRETIQRMKELEAQLRPYIRCKPQMG